VLSLVLLLAASGLVAGGRVYFVFGSDTAIWDGMRTDRYHCTYPLSLYTDRTRNAYAVMDPAFRTRLRDSYGTPMKLTWWMMCGNIFRHATNTDVPVPNVMTMYLMQRYHGEAIRAFGDELTLHYHTFVWSDYDGDGTYWWNQAKDFLDSKPDWDVTLAQLLLEEGVFPVSFRSGWHAMDNHWQHELDRLLPYSMHNDYPAVRADTSEPVDNVYDWSQASKEFVPFHPSPDNYQLAGAGKGWNVRSRHIGGVNRALVDSVFSKAQRGIDQVVCLWGHLPETDFLTNLQRCDSLIHVASGAYPGTPFLYCSAVEAMRLWRKSADTTAPLITLQEELSGEQVTYTVSTSEPIFQDSPFLAVKDLSMQYSVLPCVPVGPNQWRAAVSVERAMLAKVGCAVTDRYGNLSTTFLRYLPDDLYVDDECPEYQEIRGAWAASGSSAWGTTAREASVAPGDSALVRWNLPVQAAGRYHLYAQVQSRPGGAGGSRFRVLQGGSVVASTAFDSPLPGRSWIYIGTPQLDPAGTPAVEYVATSTGASAQLALADVIRCTPLVREKEIVVGTGFLSFGTVSLGDTVGAALEIFNRGIAPLDLGDVRARLAGVSVMATFPMVIPPMQKVSIPVALVAAVLGPVADTLFVESNDPVTPVAAVPYGAEVLRPFVVVDNEDGPSYSEVGAWYNSVANANGPTSRYAWRSAGESVSATFRAVLEHAGEYEVSQIVPKTVNATNRAMYVIAESGIPLDTVFLDQNAGSGAWVALGRYRLAAVPVQVTVRNSSQSTAGDVLRADAVRWSLLGDPTGVDGQQDGQIPSAMRLAQNFPNPFNPTTTIEYAVPPLGSGPSGGGKVHLVVYDMLGREVAVLVDDVRGPGVYRATFNASALPSGVYVYRLTAGQLTQSRKMVLLR
jgi:hypothetical protein